MVGMSPVSHLFMGRRLLGCVARVEQVVVLASVGVSGSVVRPFQLCSANRVEWALCVFAGASSS
jgi:hypothetical protein